MMPAKCDALIMGQSFSIVESVAVALRTMVNVVTGAAGCANYSITNKTKHKYIPIKNHIYIFLFVVTCHVFVVLDFPPLKRLNLSCFRDSFVFSQEKMQVDVSHPTAKRTDG